MLLDWSSARRFEGAHMYGSDLSSWPCDIFDAWDVFAFEDNKIENAKIDTDRD